MNPWGFSAVHTHREKKEKKKRCTELEKYHESWKWSNMRSSFHMKINLKVQRH